MIVGERGAGVALAPSEYAGPRGGRAGVVSTKVEAAGPELRVRRWDPGAQTLAELVAVMLRARSPDARQLARVIVRSSAPRRLEEGDAEGFRAEVLVAVNGLWPRGDVPFPVCWALQAAGIRPAAGIRASAG